MQRKSGGGGLFDDLEVHFFADGLGVEVEAVDGEAVGVGAVRDAEGEGTFFAGHQVDVVIGPVGGEDAVALVVAGGEVQHQRGCVAGVFEVGDIAVQIDVPAECDADGGLGQDVERLQVVFFFRENVVVV